MLMPLLGVGFQVSLQFAVVETLKKAMKAQFANEEGKLSLPIIMACGAIASIPSALTVVIHHICRLLLTMPDLEF